MMLLLLPCSWITARLRHFRLLYCTAKRQKRRGEYSKTKETDPWMAAATEGVDKDLEIEEEREKVGFIEKTAWRQRRSG